MPSIRNPGYGLAQLQVDAKKNARYKDRDLTDTVHYYTPIRLMHDKEMTVIVR